ncbi:hypothetical protein O3M35_006508 [Rhynocoris fuscipes]|uniref:WASH complex subunit 7 n=1 Tax=Rhynocoris fuscipes TaxID=488301 RepID=A0AAW1DG67_9HEMI
MDLIDKAGKQVLQSYGQFLDTIGIKLYHMNESLESFPESITKPIKIDVLYKEHSQLYERVALDDSVHNKVLVTFTAIFVEIEKLKDELLNEFVHKILNYGEINGEDLSNTEVCISACQLVPTLIDVINFARRCRQVLHHTLEEVLGVQQYQWVRSQSHLSTIFWMLGEISLILVALDELFNYDRENTIERHMIVLTDKVKRMVSNDSTHNLSHLITLVNQIRTELLSSTIFQDSLRVPLEKKSTKENMEALIDQINAYFKVRLVELEAYKENDIHASQTWSNLIALYGLAINTLGISDKKILKGFQDLSKKFLVSCMFGEVMWMPSKFLSRQLTYKMREAAPKLPSANNFLLVKALEQEESTLARDLKHYSFLVTKWALQMENLMSTDTICQNWNGVNTASICLEGADLCDSLKQTVNRLRYYHSILGRPMVKQAALYLCKLVQLSLAITEVFNRHNISMSKQANHVIEQIAAHALVALINAKKDAGKSRNMDHYSLLSIAEEVLYSGCSIETLCMAELACSITALKLQPLNILCKLARLSNRIDNLVIGCLSHKQMLLLHLSHRVKSDAIKYATIQHVLNSSPYIDSDNEDEEEDGQISEVDKRPSDKNYLQCLLRTELCEPIETWLRLAAHCHLRKDSSATVADNPDFRSLMLLPPFQFSQFYVSIKGFVESYLDCTFYDMSTVALHDWQSYREMRSLAEHKLGLNTVDDHLPSHTLSQSMDLVDIVRNIDMFVTKFAYNLNSQCFVERSSNNKHLNTITVDHVSNSIATHGTGIINTTTNYIYQFIKKKLVVLSQLIYDEKVSCRLTKERDQFLEAKKQRLEVIYPYDRADKVNKQVGRIGIGPDGLDLLDKFITIITQIGNAVGLVRMVRSGGIHQCLKTSEYISKAEDILDLDFGRNEISSFESLSTIVGNINHNLNEGHEYLKLLVEAFADVCISKENGHLKLMAILIPILSISYVQYMVTAKEKTSKRNRDTIIFTDDGLPIGVTYLLRVLQLETEFDSLHWFDSVSKKFFDQEQSLVQNSVTSDDNTNKLAVRRLRMYKKEFDLLYYSLVSARVFF